MIRIIVHRLVRVRAGCQDDQLQQGQQCSHRHTDAEEGRALSLAK
jgi:hypothetical protein